MVDGVFRVSVSMVKLGYGDGDRVIGVSISCNSTYFIQFACLRAPNEVLWPYGSAT